MAVIEAAGVRRVMLVTQAHGGWPAIRLCRRLGNRVTKIALLSWQVLDPQGLVVSTIHPSAVLRAGDAETRECSYAGLVADLVTAHEACRRGRS